MKCKFLFRHKGIITIYFLTVFMVFNEVLTYWFATLSWKSIECNWETRCTKILLVADPQLMGLHNGPFFVSPFAIWDSDRYLSTTFAYAFKFTKPDVVIFLGDLFHEGSKSTDIEFHSYVNRLRGIFERKWAAGAEHIYIPGNTDVIDKGSNLIIQSKVDRFADFFKQSTIFWTKNLKVHNANRLLHTNVHRIVDEKGPVVGISHLPLVPSTDKYTDQIFQQLEPHVLFSTHNPDIAIYKENYDGRPHDDDIPVRMFVNNEIYIRKIEIGQVHEFIVPSCSYRSGQEKIGYGLAVIDEKEVRYTVLWTPSRFLQLTLYGILVLIFLSWMLLTLYKKIVRPKYKILSGDAHLP